MLAIETVAGMGATHACAVLADAPGPVPRLEVPGAIGTAEHVPACGRELAGRVSRAARTGGGP